MQLAGSAPRAAALGSSGRCRAARPARRVAACRASASNGNGKAPSSCPTPAETARTIADLCSEGALCTACADGAPLGSPVAYALDAEGNPLLDVVAGSPEAANLAATPRVSLLVTPPSHPARGVASVALQGTAAALEDQAGVPDGARRFKLAVQQAVYYGGLDQASHGQVVDGDAYRAAEPDLLRRSAAELINTWNSERAEDIYRIVAVNLGVPLVEMLYAELLWVDRLGLYVRAEALGRAPAVVRVPFHRPVLDERDARSVVTMASHVCWEAERALSGAQPYVPPATAAAPSASNN